MNASHKYHEASIATGATSGANGSLGLVPQPQSGDDIKFLRGDMTYSTVANVITSTPVTVTSSSNSLDLDISSARVFKHAFSEDTTISFSGTPEADHVEIILETTQDSTDRTLTFPAAVIWAGGSAATVSLGAGKIDVFKMTTLDGGTTWYGQTIGKDFS